MNIDIESRLKNKRWTIFLSYLLGLPFWFLMVSASFYIVATFFDDGCSMSFFYTLAPYEDGFLTSFVTFVISLSFFASSIIKDIVNKINLLKSAFFYSLKINSFVWISFLIAVLLDNNIRPVYFFVAIICFILSTIITSFTYGLCISSLIRKKFFNQDLNMNFKLIMKLVFIVCLFVSMFFIFRSDYVVYKPHYLSSNSECKYYGEPELDSIKSFNTTYVLSYYGEEFKIEDNIILITRKLNNDWDLVWNYTLKSENETWLNNH